MSDSLITCVHTKLRVQSEIPCPAQSQNPCMLRECITNAHASVNPSLNVHVWETFRMGNAFSLTFFCSKYQCFISGSAKWGGAAPPPLKIFLQIAKTRRFCPFLAFWSRFRSFVRFLARFGHHETQTSVLSRSWCPEILKNAKIWDFV